ncbi:hypothetical protein TrLO_g3793 [Triparma laevis f. longispina]|uniref:ATP-dependent RNA helicase n=1 Tax=Triparma laevis f. longispina TaxID=1714387 RepID=A0A9W6ZVB9_9STRA|nr:hypothetical protein TrLO_g3793 [Triparma laevis f. longispina]
MSGPNYVHFPSVLILFLCIIAASPFLNPFPIPYNKHSKTTFLHSSTPSSSPRSASTTTPTTTPFHPSLPPWLNTNLASSNYTSPTSIQISTLSAILLSPTSTSHLLLSPTGSGKTLSYLLPLLSTLTPRQSLQSIIIVPTRELVIQVTWLLRSLTNGTGYTCMPVTGEGRGMDRSKGWILKDPPSIIVGTPSAITSTLKGSSWSSKITSVIVDEVDECLRLHSEDLNIVMGRILSGTFTGNRSGDKRFTIFASATMKDRRYFLKDVVKRGWTGSAEVCLYICSDDGVGEIEGVEGVEGVIDFGGKIMPKGLKHKYAVVNEQEGKEGMLRKWVKKVIDKKGKCGAVIIFIRSERDLFNIAEKICKDNDGIVWGTKCDEGLLKDEGVEVVVSVLKEGESARERQSALEVFKGEISRRDKRVGGWGEEEGEGGDEDDIYRKSKLRILVSTDNTASRGIDCPDCHTVFNFDLPDSGTSYVHRGGRAGRFGRKGEVLSIVGKKEEFVINRIGNEVGVVMKCVGREV